jgi:hypothetical protein
LEQFLEEIPKKIFRVVCQFKWRQIVLLRMIRNCPETMDLLESNPILTWFCADAIAKNETSISQVRDIISSKRRDICAFVGIEATDSMVKIVSVLPTHLSAGIRLSDIIIA